MNFHIVTLFPGAFDSYFGESILKRAIEDTKITVKFYNPRDFSPEVNTKGKAVRIDKKPYGGGPGMVIEALPVIKALEAIMKKIKHPRLSKTRATPSLYKEGDKGGVRKIKIIWLSPGGKVFDTEYAKSAAKKYTDIAIICGRYEGIDSRVKKIFKTEDISVGPFVLTGGELPAMIIIDCISRQVEGVLGDFNSLEETRVSAHDVYTRPEVLEYKKKKYKVPKVLLSGNHAEIEKWKTQQ
ncbi:MAG: tRNA (guanosine(37)-N1)-methyltransferase TrmD [bacterium]|nr:tRNA (guanosine(37)-N1)-methyltransferase TrmD [bacterium]